MPSEHKGGCKADSAGFAGDISFVGDPQRLEHLFPSRKDKRQFLANPMLWRRAFIGDIRRADAVLPLFREIQGHSKRYKARSEVVNPF